MTARIVALGALVALACQPARATQLTLATELGPPLIRLEASEVLQVTRRCAVSLQGGESLLALPVKRLGVDPAAVRLSLEPADCLSVVSMESGPQAPGCALWRLRASRDVEADVVLTYPVKGLSWGIEYAATLASDGGLALEGRLRVTNGLGRDLENATMVGDGFIARVSVEDAETITQTVPRISGSADADAVARGFVYDHERHGDTPVELLTVPSEALRPTATVPTGLDLRAPELSAFPPGKVRIYAPAESGGQLIAEDSLPYTPVGEPIELNLGPASGIVVTRTRAEAKEVNQRLDAHNKVAVYDLQETWELELRNLRAAPVELLVREHHDGFWSVEDSSLPHLREDATTLAFRLTLGAGERRDLSYRLLHRNRQP